MCELSTISELAAKTGSKRRAVALLCMLGVPVVQGVFSRRLLLAKLEGKDETSVDPDADPRRLTQELLADVGLVVVRFRPGHPRTVTLTPSGATVRIGQPEIGVGEDSPFAPFVLRHGEKAEAVLHLTRSRGSSTANFLVSGLDKIHAGDPPLFVLILASERRVWMALRTELKAFRDLAVQGDARPWFSRAPRPGCLRVAFPKAKIDFDAKMRVAPQEKPA